MRGLTSALTWALFTFSSLAAADPGHAILQPRQGTGSLTRVICGDNTYSRNAVDAAVAEGCRLHAAGRQVGRNKYPHAFKNFEKIQFAAAGPYQEFPILSNGAVYSGDAPGPDRVIFNPDLDGECTYVGSITHTGAQSNNGFVSCVEEFASPTTSTAGAPAPTESSGAANLAGWVGEGLVAVVGAVAGLAVL